MLEMLKEALGWSWWGVSREPKEVKLDELKRLGKFVCSSIHLPCVKFIRSIGTVLGVGTRG